MSEYTDEQLENMSDEELESAAQEATTAMNTEPDDEPEGKANAGESEIETEDNIENEVPDTEDEEEDEPSDEVEEEDSETSTEDDGQDDGQPETEEDDTEDESTETQPEVLTFDDLKVDGKLIPINSLEELYTLASGGGNLTQKYQKLSDHKKSIAIMNQHKLSETDISLYAEALGGNKDALASLIKRSGIDTMEIEEDPSEGYVPGQFVPTDRAMNIQDIQDEISRDEEYSTTQNVVNNMMDEHSQEMLVQNPEMIRGIHMDIKSGAYQITQAKAEKLKLMDGGRRPFMEYYIAAAQQEAPQQQQTPAPTESQAPAKKPANKSKKRAAGSTTTKTPPKSIKDVNDMGDDELMEYRESIMSKYEH